MSTRKKNPPSSENDYEYDLPENGLLGRLARLKFTIRLLEVILN